jgi:hypothetical protein
MYEAGKRLPATPAGEATGRQGLSGLPIESEPQGPKRFRSTIVAQTSERPFWLVAGSGAAHPLPTPTRSFAPWPHRPAGRPSLSGPRGQAGAGRPRRDERVSRRPAGLDPSDLRAIPTTTDAFMSVSFRLSGLAAGDAARLRSVPAGSISRSAGADDNSRDHRAAPSARPCRAAGTAWRSA